MVNQQLKTFTIVAESGSFSKASEQLFISPNAVARQINMLEQRLQLKLFERTRQGLKLTSEGAFLYGETKKMLSKSEEILNNIRRMNSLKNSVIRVGTSPMHPHTILQSRWRLVADQAPEITLQIEPYRDDFIGFQELLSHLGESIDVIPRLHNEPYYKGKCNILHLADQPVRIGVPIYHQLAWKPCLGRKDLNGQTILLVKSDKSPVLRQIKQDILSHCAGVRIEEIDILDYPAFNRAVNENKLVVTVNCLQDVHPMIRTIPVGWKYSLQSSLLYSLNPSPVVQKLIHLLETPGIL